MRSNILAVDNLAIELFLVNPRVFQLLAVPSPFPEDGFLTLRGRNKPAWGPAT